MLQLGGFERAAQILSHISGRPWTRQYIHLLWRARGEQVTIFGRLIPPSGFPDQYEIEVNGRVRRYFDMDDVVRWYQERENERRR